MFCVTCVNFLYGRRSSAAIFSRAKKRSRVVVHQPPAKLLSFMLRAYACFHTLRELPQFYDQIATMTLSQVAPMSQGAIDDAKLKEIQAEFDKL